MCFVCVVLWFGAAASWLLNPMVVQRIIVCWTFAFYNGMGYYTINVFCLCRFVIWCRGLYVAVCVWMWEKGDGDDAVSVSDYVAQLLADLRQQPAHERKRLFFELKNLVVRDSKNGKPSLVDIARFKQLAVGHQEGRWLQRKEIVPVIMDALMGELVDSSAAAPGPAMGFKVAPHCFVFCFLHVL